MFGNLGNDLFVLVGAYFLVGLDYSKVIDRVKTIWKPTIFYSLLIFFLACFVLHTIPFTPLDLVQSIFPVIFSKYWFVTSYIMLVLFAPILSVVTKKLSKQHYRYLLILGAAAVCIWPLLTPWLSLAYNLSASSIGIFMYLFFIAGYIKKFKPKIAVHKLVLTLVWLIGICIALSITAVNSGSTWAYDAIVRSMTSPVIVLVTVSILLLALNARAIKSKLLSANVNMLASTMFGVYLIHANIYLLSFIYNDIFHGSAHYGGVSNYLYPLIVTAVVFSVCVLIEFGRQRLFALVAHVKAKLGFR